jgi:predicted TPR repeat methyltransferase
MIERDVSNFSTSNIASGNMLADRRYAWGTSAAEDGNDLGAADLFEQTVELAPDWAPAWFSLGQARVRQGLFEGAIFAFTRSQALDIGGGLGSSLHLSILGAGAAPAIAPPAYVAALFDQYAERFDTHLVTALAYCGPALLRRAIEQACTAGLRTFHFIDGCDLGCGTGLMAKAMVPNVGLMIGVDISPNMVAAAQATLCYEQLFGGDMQAFLTGQATSSRDLMLAADVFVYVGDLAGIFAQCARVLRPGGVFAFSVQQGLEGWSLGADLRYAHSRGYLLELAADNDFENVVLDAAFLRKDAGVNVPGLVCVMTRA